MKKRDGDILTAFFHTPMPLCGQTKCPSKKRGGVGKKEMEIF
jgi:hypothetical protein